MPRAAAAMAALAAAVLLMAAPAHTSNPSLMKSLAFDTARDFTAVCGIMDQPLYIAVQTSMGVNSIAELVTLLKANPKKYNYGTSGAGGPQHLMGEMFKSATGTEIAHIPYRGAAPAAAALLAGDTQVAFSTPTNIAPHVKAGKLRALAVTTKDRSVILPEVPTMMEAGVPDYVVATWLGFAVPANTPAAIVTRLNAEINRIGQLPQVKEKLLVQGFEILPPATPEAARQLIVDDQAVWLPIIKQSGATAE